MADERHNVQSRNLAEYTEDLRRDLPRRVQAAIQDFKVEGFNPDDAQLLALGYVIGRQYRAGASPAFVHELSALFLNPPRPPLYMEDTRPDA